MVRPSKLALATALLVGGLAFPPVLSAASTNAAASAEAAMPPALTELSIPRSEFNIPTNPQEGRDPFFPNSSRFVVVPVAAKPDKAPVVGELVLRGLAGTAARRLATINSEVFEVGEEKDVVTSTGARVRVRCLEIQDDGVLIRVGGQQRELRFQERR